MDDVGSLILPLCLGIGLASAAGLRATYPLLALSVLAQTGWLHLGASFAWLGSVPALATFAIAAVLEFAADKIPGIDHALHAIGLALAPIAGTLVVAATLRDMDPLPAMVIGIIAGAAPAAIVQAARSALRPLSTAATGGLGNWAVSAGEGAVALATIAGAILVPVFTAAVALAAVAACAVMLVRLARRLKAARA
jgi:hypothetical protein